jgi:hypothetical protein
LKRLQSLTLFVWFLLLTMMNRIQCRQSFVGILLIKQPFFILGIDDVEAAKGSAFGAAGTFFVTFLVSVIYLIMDGRRVNAEVVSGVSLMRGGRQQSNRFGEYTTVAFSDDVGGNRNNEFHYA